MSPIVFMENENIGWEVGFPRFRWREKVVFGCVFYEAALRCFSVPVPNSLFSTRLPSFTMRLGFGDAVKELLCGFSTDSAKDKEMGIQRSHSWEPVKMQAHPRQK